MLSHFRHSHTLFHKGEREREEEEEGEEEEVRKDEMRDRGKKRKDEKKRKQNNVGLETEETYANRAIKGETL